MFIDGWIDKEDMVCIPKHIYIHVCVYIYIMCIYVCIFIHAYAYNGILFSPKKEGSYAICSDMDGPSDHHAKKVKYGIISFIYGI